MLVIARKEGEGIMIGDDIKVMILGVVSRNNRKCLSFTVFLYSLPESRKNTPDLMSSRGLDRR